MGTEGKTNGMKAGSSHELSERRHDGVPSTDACSLPLRPYLHGPFSLESPCLTNKAETIISLP